MGLSAPAEIDIVDKGVAQRLGWFVRVVGAAGILVGTGVLAGYAFHIPLLIRLHSGLQAMSVLTAAGTGLMGLALVAESVGRRRLARSFGAIVLAGSLTLLCSPTLAGADVINRPLAEHLFAFDPEVAGRTSFATAMGLLLIAASLQFEGRPDVEGVNLSNACAVLGAAIGGIALMGYAYGVRDLYAFSPFNTMALHTAAGLFLLGLAARWRSRSVQACARARGAERLATGIHRRVRRSAADTGSSRRSAARSRRCRRACGVRGLVRQRRRVARDGSPSGRSTAARRLHGIGSAYTQGS